MRRGPQQVAEALGALGEQLHGEADLQVLGEDQNAGFGPLSTDLAGRLQALVRVRRRHPDVDDGDVRPVCGDGGEELVGVGALRDHVDAAFAEQGGEPFADQDRVVGDYDAHGSSAVSVVPRPGGLTISSSNPCLRSPFGHLATGPRRRQPVLSRESRRLTRVPPP